MNIKYIRFGIPCLMIILILSGGYLIYQYNTNYNWRYKEFLRNITEVSNKEEIVKVKMSYSHHPSTFFTITVPNSKLTQEQVIKMTHDIAEKIEKLMPDEKEQTLTFNILSINLSVQVVDNNQQDLILYQVCGYGKMTHNSITGENEGLKWSFEVFDYQNN